MVNSTLDYNRISKLFKENTSDHKIIPVLESLIAVYKEEQLKNRHSSDIPQLPLHIFSEKRLGILEAATKYLKENQSMKYCEIAKHLNRDERTVWVSYNNAIKKRKNKFEPAKIEHYIPCNIFSNRKLGPLESLVVYLRDDLKLSIQEISKYINRNYMSVYLSYKNGKKK
jgi:hypothetical protein